MDQDTKEAIREVVASELNKVREQEKEELRQEQAQKNKAKFKNMVVTYGAGFAACTMSGFIPSITVGISVILAAEVIDKDIRRLSFSESIGGALTGAFLGVVTAQAVGLKDSIELADVQPSLEQDSAYVQIIDTPKQINTHVLKV